MHVVTLQDPTAAVTAQFVPDAGMIGISLADDGDELLGQRRGLDAYLSAGKTMGLPLLYPWANRLSSRTYRVGDDTVEIAEDAVGVRTDEHGLPIHGLLAARPDWRVRSETADRLVAEFDFAASPDLLASFPFPHTLEIAATLRERTLSIRTVVTPTGDRPVPLCFGFHPYLQLPGTPRAQWIVEIPPLRHLDVDDRGLPTGATRRQPATSESLSDRVFDDGYDEVTDGAVFAVSGGGRRITVRFDTGYPAAQIFAPAGEDVICFEPMTAPTDALTRGGYRTARPGKPAGAQFSIGV
ncbi:aldose 1-epimerase [Mycobacterium sp. ACS4331]|uniref:aldose 1-epimerase n=1 Tax=Mycobacterium sp. ACS4331 TaxID=1834121 RepID=UPI0007FC817E|nr:aldose 1-epimerase [Mycobacterium sp. ACS4331]OBF12973.1 aldose epimerase [Mycobacterium sp. ACS4331]